MIKTHFLLAYESEVVLPVKIGMPNHHIEYLEARRNEEALTEHLDILDKKRTNTNEQVTTNKRKAEQYFNR